MERYCEKCGCYIPVSFKACPACSSDVKKKESTAAVSETNRYMPKDDAAAKAMEEAEKRRAQMREQFERHKAAAEERTKAEK